MLHSFCIKLFVILQKDAGETIVKISSKTTILILCIGLISRNQTIVYLWCLVIKLNGVQYKN